MTNSTASDELERTSSIHTAYAQSTLNAGGAIFAAIQWYWLDSRALVFAEIATLVAGIASAFAARSFRDRWTRQIGGLVFIANVIPAMAMMWIVHTRLATLGQIWVPFQTHQLSVLAIAMLAPAAAWAGIGAIVAIVAAAILQFQTFPASSIALIPRGQPGSVVAFGMFALVLLFYRLSGREKDRELARTAEQTRIVRQTTRVLLAVRDLVNSPVQTLTLDAELVRLQHPESAALAQRMRRSAERLQRLNELVTKQSEGLLEQSDADVSFDADKILDTLHID